MAFDIGASPVVKAGFYWGEYDRLVAEQKPRSAAVALKEAEYWSDIADWEADNAAERQAEEAFLNRVNGDDKPSDPRDTWSFDYGELEFMGEW